MLQQLIHPSQLQAHKKAVNDETRTLSKDMDLTSNLTNYYCPIERFSLECRK